MTRVIRLSPRGGHATSTQAVLRPARGYHAFEACVEQLATTIRLGVYPRGTMLPPERELAAAAARLAVDAARGDGGAPAGRTGRDHPGPRRRHRGHPEAAYAVRPGRRPGAGRAPPGLARRPRLPADRRARRRRTWPPPPTSSDGARAQLEKAHADVVGARRPAQHRQADSRFHLTVAALTGSPRVVEAVTSVQSTLHEMLLAIPVLEANIAHSDRQHAALVRAILGRQPERARRVMEEHCDDTAALLRGLRGMTDRRPTDDRPTYRPRETPWHRATTGT